jgi:hypothetical protein
MRAVVVVFLVACSSPEPLHLLDGGADPLHYQLHISFDSTRADMPRVFVDGVETMSVEAYYTSFHPIHHDIELRYADQVLARLPVDVSPGDCGSPDTVWSTIDEYVGAAASGDLRFNTDEWRGPETACVGDGFGVPHCACGTSERCAPRILRSEPLFTQMACVPIGAKAAGDPCTLTDDPAGAYDDCGENLVCIAGTCTAFCSPDIPPEYPPELTTRCP